jgi:hypothetical protein
MEIINCYCVVFPLCEKTTQLQKSFFFQKAFLKFKSMIPATEMMWVLRKNVY